MDEHPTETSVRGTGHFITRQNEAWLQEINARAGAGFRRRMRCADPG
jgi:hypothetical protein